MYTVPKGTENFLMRCSIMTIEKIAKILTENGIDYEIKYHKFERALTPTNEEEDIEGLVLTIEDHNFQSFDFSDLISFSTVEEYECYMEVTEKEKKDYDRIQREYSDLLWAFRLADIFYSYYGETLYKIDNSFVSFHW